MSFFSRLLEPVYGATVVLSYGSPGIRLRAKGWDPNALKVDCAGRVALVTGANSGIGRAIAHALAARGAEVILVSRNAERGNEARASIARETGNSRVRLELADVSLVSQLADLVRRVRERTDRLDVLVNNAGVLLDTRQVTDEGLEKTFATNVLAGFALTSALRPQLVRAAASHLPARVVTVTSGGLYTQRYNEDDPFFEKRYDGVAAYAQTKRAQLLLNTIWAERLGPQGIVASAMHPGWAATPGVADSLPRFSQLLGGALRTAEEGADTAVWLAVSEEAKDTNGKLYFDREARRAHIMPWTRSPPATGERLYALCARLLSERANPSVFGL